MLQDGGAVLVYYSGDISTSGATFTACKAVGKREMVRRPHVRTRLSPDYFATKRPRPREQERGIEAPTPLVATDLPLLVPRYQTGSGGAMLAYQSGDVSLNGATFIECIAVRKVRRPP